MVAIRQTVFSKRFLLWKLFYFNRFHWIRFIIVSLPLSRQFCWYRAPNRVAIMSRPCCNLEIVGFNRIRWVHFTCSGQRHNFLHWWCQWSDRKENELTHWGRDKLYDIFQNIFKCIFFNENVWNSIKISLEVVPKVQFTISQHWFRWWLCARGGAKWQMIYVGIVISLKRLKFWNDVRWKVFNRDRKKNETCL